MINKGDIFVYPLCRIKPNVKYYVEDVFDDPNGQSMTIVSWDDDNSPNGKSKIQCETERYLSAHKTGHIKFIGNKNFKPAQIIKRHHFNPTPYLACWKERNPYKEPNLFEWT